MIGTRKSGITLAVIVLAVLALLNACQPTTIEVTRVVTEVVTQEVEVTRIVAGESVTETVVQEVEVTRMVEAAPDPEEENKLEIFHWWTAGGEREAADAMFDVFRAEYPDVEIVENPVAGGGGVSHRLVLQARLSAGLPPDAWQTLGGAELKDYVDAGQLQPLDDIYDQTDYAGVIPRPLLNAVSIDGSPYGAPLNMHFQNILYYNTALFEELELDAPTTLEQLMVVVEAIEEARPEMTPLALGTSEKWESAFVFDSILLALAGPDYYVDLYKGNIDIVTDDTFREALNAFGQLKSYMYEFHPNLTWDESVDLVVNEDAAMVIMGTWAIGYFASRDWQPGEAFGAVTFPQEPERILLFHPDTYGIAAGAPHPQIAENWVRMVTSPELQIPTNVTQGGLFARMDIDPNEFPDPVRRELQSFVNENPGNLILDQHGSIAPFNFTQDYWDALTAFLANEQINEATIDVTTQSIANLFEIHDVQEGAAWYRWP
ncbi:MAG TPA: ABC transporter substrate-binding protein [Candidatus Sulfomarinibacteraceae bacterium]|nr:ABC transporter substrate-binding protein [Candidatus Sulfomarinibacteraceae bacterium]